MALKDVENIAIFHFNNICLSPVIFTSRSVCHASCCCFLFPLHILRLLLLSFVYTQLLPTLDIYTWTEEHVVSINLFPLILL